MMKVLFCVLVAGGDAAATTVAMTTTTIPSAPSGFAEFKDQKCSNSGSKIEIDGSMKDYSILFEKSTDYDKAVKACAFECLRLRGCGGFQIPRSGSTMGRCLAYPGNCKMGAKTGESWFGVQINGTAGAVDPAGKLTSCNTNVPGYASAAAQAGYCPYPTFDGKSGYDKEAFAAGAGSVATCANACNLDPKCGGFGFVASGALKGRCVKKGPGFRFLTGRADNVMYAKIHTVVTTTNAAGIAGDSVRKGGATAVAVTTIASMVLHHIF